MDDNNGSGTRREKPWLFPSNRKLRHLHAISVRNLVVTPPSPNKGKKAKKPTDDEDIPNTLQSPSKLMLANDPTRSLHQSRSLINLKSRTKAQEAEDTSRGNDNNNNNNNKQALRPPCRSTSTIPWNDPDPHMRQVYLEDITKTRMADSWFSVHCEGIEEPVYVSEVIENATNPSFRSFNLEMCGPLVSRWDQVTLKLWAKPAAATEYMFLVELQLHLQSLQFLGRSLDSFHQPLPSNFILFHFSDGVYANLTEIPPAAATGGLKYAGSDDSAALPTSSYDALMRLANLDECIQDALATREKLEAQISSILQQNQHAMTTTSEESRAQDKFSFTRNAVNSERRRLRMATKRKEELVSSVKARKEAMERGCTTQEKARSHLPDAQLKLASSARLLDRNTEEAKGQIRRISEDLLAVYPIEPIPDEPLAFSIAGLVLPNSNFEDIDRDVVAAALGYTAHLVYLLSFYLSVPVPYPVKPYMSQSLIHDPVSASLPQRTYPLYPVNVHYRFEYGVFLLNKDIEILLNKQGLRAFDIRHTLPNLKYLLYVLTAGKSEIPARKAGGIRGLYPGRLSPNVSRRGSNTSSTYGESIRPTSKGLDPGSMKLNGDAATGVGGGGGKGKKPISPIAGFAKTSSPVA